MKSAEKEKKNHDEKSAGDFQIFSFDLAYARSKEKI